MDRVSARVGREGGFARRRGRGPFRFFQHSRKRRSEVVGSREPGPLGCTSPGFAIGSFRRGTARRGAYLEGLREAIGDVALGGERLDGAAEGLDGLGVRGGGGGRQRARVAGVACVTGIVAMIGAARGRFGAGEDLGAHLRRGGDARGRPAGGDARDGRDDAEGGDGGGGHFERARLV